MKKKSKAEWCERCTEQANTPDPSKSLIQPRWEHFARELVIQKKSGADAYMAAVRNEAEDYRRSVVQQTDEGARRIREEAQAEAGEAMRVQKEHVDEEIRRAMAGIEKMQQAVQSELEAQQAFTEALRMKAFSPRGREPIASISDDAELEGAAEPAPKPRRRSTSRK